MHEAHCLNLPTSATMMYGHVETPHQRIDHLLRIRDLQTRCPEGNYGFIAFIPWIFRSTGTELERQGVETRFSPLEYLRIIAVSRLMLHNIPNIQASWLTVGKATAQAALHSGANDHGVDHDRRERRIVGRGAQQFRRRRHSVRHPRSGLHPAPAGPALPDAGICAANRGTCDIASRRLTAHHAATPKHLPRRSKHHRNGSSRILTRPHNAVVSGTRAQNL